MSFLGSTFSGVTLVLRLCGQTDMVFTSSMQTWDKRTLFYREWCHNLSMSFETVIHLVCFCHAFYDGFKGILLTAVQINKLPPQWVKSCAIQVTMLQKQTWSMVEWRNIQNKKNYSREHDSGAPITNRLSFARLQFHCWACTEQIVSSTCMSALTDVTAFHTFMCTCNFIHSCVPTIRNKAITWTHKESKDWREENSTQGSHANHKANNRGRNVFLQCL